jgi:hypothetical protein
VSGILAAFGTATFDGVTDGKRGILHDSTSFLWAGQEMSDKSLRDHWNLPNRLDNRRAENLARPSNLFMPQHHLRRA